MCTAIWCVLSPLSRSASFAASELTYLLNAHASAHAASTYSSLLTEFALPVLPVATFRSDHAWEPLPLNLSIISMPCPPPYRRLDVSSLLSNSTAALWNQPGNQQAFHTKRASLAVTSASTDSVAAR
eukprot:6210511-Pleurochrysis_carterae.AAC.1